MNIFNGIAPPYATAVLIELIEKKEEYFVQVLYRNDSTRESYILTVPGDIIAVGLIDISSSSLLYVTLQSPLGYRFLYVFGITL